MKSWKIGAIAGLIAGIVGGIATFVNILSVLIPAFGIKQHWGLETLSTEVIRIIAYVEITLSIIWWIAAGLIYVKIYDLIPGKGILKGLVYSLGMYLIFCVRTGSLELFYGRITVAIAWFSLFYTYIIGGLVFGASYEFLSNKYSVTKYKPKISKNDSVKGIYAGAFGGLAMGIVVFLYMSLIVNPYLYQSFAADVGFLIGQLGTHMFFNMVWCASFGVLFVRFYERIPGKGLLKGFIFSMVIFFFTTGRTATFSLAYGQILWFIANMLAILGFLAFGIIIGYIYKPKK